MKYLLKASVLSISLLVIIAGSAVSPVLSEIKAAFPYTDSSLIKMIVTLPSIVLVPFSLLSGKILSIIKKKTLLIIGLILYIIGGVGAGFSRNINDMLVFRAILGVGMGALLPLSTSLIADFYKNEERRVMMGLSNAVANLGSVIATLITGWIAILSWRYTFFIYGIAFLVLILIIIGLPEPSIKYSNKVHSFYLNNAVLVLAFLGFLLNIAFYAVITNISIYVTARNLGNSGVAGIALSMLTLAGFISGVFLNKISDFLRVFRASAFTGVMGLGFILLSLGRNPVMVFFSTFLIGFGLGVLKPIILLKVTEVTPQHSNAFALSVVSSSMYFGKFISPIFLDFVGKFIGITSTSFIFAIIGISLGGIAIYFLNYAFQPKLYDPTS